MTLRNLQVFLAVAESGSMVNAAKKLYMTQPSISQIISEMERDYNVTLFDRKNRKLQLTETGKRLVDYAKKTLISAKETEDFLNFESSHPHISVGATPTIGACFMSPIVVKLHEEIPNLVHNVKVLNSSQIIKDLINGTVDIALIEGKVEDPEIESRPVIRDRLVLICSKNHKFMNRLSVDIRELENEPLVVREKGSAMRQQIEEGLLSVGIEPSFGWSSSDYDTIIDAVKNGLGVGIISERLSRKERIRKSLHICDITGVDSSFNYRLAFRKGRMFPESLLEFIRICEEFGALDDILAKSE